MDVCLSKNVTAFQSVFTTVNNSITKNVTTCKSVLTINTRTDTKNVNINPQCED